MSGRRSYALVTGASRGIGAALAEALAGEGWNLILSARSGEDLERQRARLARPGIAIQCVTADLRAGGAAQLLEEVARQGWEVDLLVNNAGLGSGGEFAGLELGRELEEVQVNIAAVVELTHGCLAGMRGRGRGAVIQVASTAAYQPVPYMATYAATKAFVLHFSLALHEEMRKQGIHVMALCPGPTRTNFFQAAGLGPGRGETAEGVARRALAGLKARRAVVVSGGNNRALVAAVRWLPRRVVTQLAARMMKSWQRTARGGRAALPAGKIGAKGREPGSPEPASGSGVVVIPKGGPPPESEFGAAPAKRSAGLGPRGPQAGVSTSGTRGAAAQGPAPTT